MPDYNDMFELTVEDMELIETALRRTKESLSQEQLTAPDSDADDMVNRIHELLGRLHNQKVFYYPKEGVFVGG